jgi:hypothetical protein
MEAMAEAVSWQAGARRRVWAKAGRRERCPLSRPRSVPGGTRVEVEELGMAGVGELGDGAAAEMMEDVFGEVEPAERTKVIVIGEELVGGVDAQELDAGDVAHTIGREALMELGLAGEGTLVAVAEWVGDGITVRVEMDVVDGPTIDGDGADAFGGEGGAGGEATLEFEEDVVDVPAEAAGALDGLVGKAVD